MKKEFLVIIVITLAVGAIWAISDIVHTKSQANNLPDVKQYLDAVSPSFDKQILDQVSQLSTPAPAASGLPLPSNVASSSAQPKPTITPRPLATASSSATPSASTRR
jgi:hypothetical protein